MWDYLFYLCEDVNWYNCDYSISVIREGMLWCFVSFAVGVNICYGSLLLVFVLCWFEVEMSDLIFLFVFFGLCNIVWVGYICFKNLMGEWWLVVLLWGRFWFC